MNELVKQSLTNPPPIPYPMGGVVFMEGGEGMPGSTNPDPERAGNFSSETERVERAAKRLEEDARRGEQRKAEETRQADGAGEKEEKIVKPGSADAVIKAEDEWFGHNQERKLTLEERIKQSFLRAHGIGTRTSVPTEIEGKWKHFLANEITSSPELRRRYEQQVSEVSERVPQQEALRRQQEEYHGVMAYGQLSPIDTAGVLDPELRGVAERYNTRLPLGLIDFSEVDRTVRELEQRLRDPVVAGNVTERNWARNVIDRFLGEMANIKRDQEQMQRAREERAGREYIRQRLEINYPVEELITDREKRNDFFNDLFAGVDSVPHEFFQSAFNPLTRGMRFEYFMDLIRDASVGKIEGWDEIKQGKTLEAVRILQAELAEDFLRYQTERRMRQTLHDVNAALYLASINGEQLWDHMDQFGSDLGDVAFKTAGVRQMMDIYEQAIRESLVENDGYLKPEAIIGKVERDSQGRPIVRISKGEIEERTKARFREMNEQHKIFVKNEEGKPVALERFESWEVDRVFSIAQGMMITTERLISLAAESKLPKGSYSSLFGQDILQQYSAYVHLLGKYGIGEKDLAVYLYRHEEGPLRFFRRWDASQLKEVLERFEDNQSKFLNEPHEGDDLRYLMLRNPNRAGDIFTWLSWRAQDSLDAVSMSQDFLIAGKNKMGNRIKPKAQGGLGLTPPAGVSEEDYENEYANWMGTALRLEKMRTNLSRTPEEVSRLRKEKQKEEVEKHSEKAKGIIKRMVDLQPHRLYLVSPEIRGNVDILLSQDKAFQSRKSAVVATGKPEKEIIPTILNNLSLVEGKLLGEREMLLDRGETFSTVSLDEFYSEITDQAERELAQAFAKVVLKDFNFNSRSKHYFDEFASYKREYKHGFVLWSGDAPVDEFNASALGPSGTFARRARDNKAQSEAIKEEIKLLANLKNLKNPDEIIAQLAVIYEKIANYDQGKAKQAIADKAEGIAKFYAADFLTNIPIVGIIMKLMGRGSFAQITYDDKSAAVWGAHETNYFFTRLKQKNLITKEQYDILKEKAFAGKTDLAIDIGATMGQFMALALALYLAEKLLKDKQQ